MKKIITPLKQGTLQGCLLACLAMSSNLKKFSLKKEKDILINGLDKSYDFFVVGVMEEFLKKNKQKMEIYVDNEYFTNVLKKHFKNKDIKVIHNKITLPFLDKLIASSPVISYIDYNALGEYSHAPHFIFIESKIKDKYKIVDPWIGKIQNLKSETLNNGINLLREHLKICPLIIKSQKTK